MTQTTKVQTFEEAIASWEEEKNKSEQTPKKRKVRETTSEKRFFKEVAPEEEKTKTEPIKTASAFLRHATTMAMKSYIRKNPNYIAVKQQIDALKEASLKYKSLGNSEAYEECVTRIKQLKQTASLYEKVAKNVDARNPEERAKLSDSIRNNVEYKENKKRMTELTKEMNNNKVSALISRLTTVRRALEMSNAEFDLDEIEQDLSTTIDLDDENSLENLKSSSNENYSLEYYALLKRISDISGLSTEKLAQMNSNQIKKYLENNDVQSTLDEEYNRLSSEFIELKVKNNKISRSMMGNENIISLIEESYDLEDEQDAEAAKTLLLTSYTNYVLSIAYKVCEKANMLHVLDDANSYAVLHLAEAINKWYEDSLELEFIQPLDAYLKVIGLNTMRSLGNLRSGGTMSGSSFADRLSRSNTYRRKRLIELREEFGAEVSDEFLNKIVEYEMGDTYGVGSASTESDLISIGSGGDGDDNSEIFSNMTPDTFDSGDLVDAKQAAINLRRSLKTLFSLCEKKPDAYTKRMKISNKRFFDLEDYYLFLMKFGIMVKTDENGEPIGEYKQVEMAEKLMELRRKRGVTSTMTQAAVNARLSKINAKLAIALEQYPEIREALQFILTVYTHNRPLMEKISKHINLQELMTEREETTEKIQRKIQSLDIMDL